MAVPTKDRITNLQKAAQDFSVHLKSSPGTILTPNQRLNIAISSRSAHDCTGCHSAILDGAACPLNLYRYCKEINHTSSSVSAPSSNDGADDKIHTCLTTIVHSLVCFQNKINDTWYKDCIDALTTCGILSNYLQEVQCQQDEELKVAAHAVFCEIVVLTAWSIGIYSSFLALDLLDTLPGLPTWEDMRYAPKPMHIDFSSLLYKVRRDENVAISPYFLKGDINEASSEYEKIGEETWSRVMFGPIPWACVVFVPRDLVPFLQSWMNVTYLTPGEMLLSWGKLGNGHCESVTRHDIETVASAVAAERSCDY
jgi:hypothetical protein